MSDIFCGGHIRHYLNDRLPDVFLYLYIYMYNLFFTFAIRIFTDMVMGYFRKSDDWMLLCDNIDDCRQYFLPFAAVARFPTY